MSQPLDESFRMTYGMYLNVKKYEVAANVRLELICQLLAATTHHTHHTAPVDISIPNFFSSPTTRLIEHAAKDSTQICTPVGERSPVQVWVKIFGLMAQMDVRTSQKIHINIYQALHIGQKNGLCKSWEDQDTSSWVIDCTVQLKQVLRPSFSE